MVMITPHNTVYYSVSIYVIPFDTFDFNWNNIKQVVSKPRTTKNSTSGHGVATENHDDVIDRAGGSASTTTSTSLSSVRNCE